DWRPDPFGRFELRRFFLGRPTSLVKRGKVIGYDQIDAWLPPATATEEPKAPSSAPLPPDQTPAETAETKSDDVPSRAPVQDFPSEAALTPKEDVSRGLVSRLRPH